MLKAIGFAVLALVIGLMIAAPADAANPSPPGKKGSGERLDYCQDALMACALRCLEFYPDDKDGGLLNFCNGGCVGSFDACVDAAAGTQLGPDAFEPSQSPGVLDESDLHPVHTVPVGNLGAAEVERVCSRVNGIFGRTSNGFGCINRHCDDKGSCTLVCYGGNCLAITPDKLPDRVTLLGILQNGSGVDRRPPALSPDSPDEDGGGGDDGCGQNCGIIF